MPKLTARTLLHGLGYIIVAPIVAVTVFGAAIEWLALGLWVLPAILGGWYQARHSHEERWFARGAFAVGAALTGPWVGVLHSVAPVLPPLGRLFLGLPAAADGRVVESGTDGTIYLLVAILTAVGLGVLMFFAAVEWTGREASKPEAARRRALGWTVLAESLVLVLVTRYTGHPVLGWWFAALGALLTVTAFQTDPAELYAEGRRTRADRREARASTIDPAA